MRVTPINIINSYKNINFGLSGLDKQKPKSIEDPDVAREADILKYAVEESIRRWNIDMPIPGNISHFKGNSMNLMLNYSGDVVFAHVKKANKVDRIIKISDDGVQSVARTYIFDPKTQQLKKYEEEKN